VAAVEAVEGSEDGSFERRLELLYLDVQRDVGNGLEQLAEGRDAETPAAIGIRPVGRPEAVARIEPTEGGEGERAHRTRPVGGAIDAVVVHDHDLPVSGRVHVELEPVRTRSDGGGEGIEGVLRHDTGRPPMAEQARSRTLEVARAGHSARKVASERDTVGAPPV